MTEIEQIIEYWNEKSKTEMLKAIEQYVIQARINQLYKLNLNVPECFQVQKNHRRTSSLSWGPALLIVRCPECLRAETRGWFLPV